MTIELSPLGVACNLSCTYCYQTPMRDAGNVGNRTPYDFDKMFKALAAEGGPFSVFGGEALLVPLPDLRRIWAWGFERYRQNGIQTNGVLITPEHIAAFKEFAVHVGFSLDGPGDLNDSRWHGTLERTRESTQKSHDNLRACIAAGIGTSVIVTLYRGNAVGDRLPRLLEWLRELSAMGTRGVRIHLLEVDHPVVKAKMQLTGEENVTALREIAALERELPQLRLDIFTDMRKLLRADDDNVTCTWNPCDPYTTSAVRGVDGQGNQSNCGRTNKDGVLRVKAERSGHERQLALYHTPYEHGGCKGCRFFLMCKGQCPGTSVDGDWRNRSADCRTWMTLFQDLETEMSLNGEQPLSLHPQRAALEQAMLKLWAQGGHLSLKQALQQLTSGVKVLDGPSSAHTHGDTPHGDQHGDHTDTGARAVPSSRVLPVLAAPSGQAPVRTTYSKAGTA